MGALVQASSNAPATARSCETAAARAPLCTPSCLPTLPRLPLAVCTPSCPPTLPHLPPAVRRPTCPPTLLRLPPAVRRPTCPPTLPRLPPAVRRPTGEPYQLGPSARYVVPCRGRVGVCSTGAGSTRQHARLPTARIPLASHLHHRTHTSLHPIHCSLTTPHPDPPPPPPTPLCTTARSHAALGRGGPAGL